jgi:hypothetical protein
LKLERAYVMARVIEEPAYTTLFQSGKKKGYTPQGCPIEVYLDNQLRFWKNKNLILKKSASGDFRLESKVF